MAFTKLTARDFSVGTPTTPVSEYAVFLSTLTVGEGGRTTIEAEGASRYVIKARLTAAAAETGTEIKFRRSRKTEVIFEVVSAATTKPMRRRRRRSASAETEQPEG